LAEGVGLLLREDVAPASRRRVRLVIERAESAKRARGGGAAEEQTLALVAPPPAVLAENRVVHCDGIAGPRTPQSAAQVEIDRNRRPQLLVGGAVQEDLEVTVGLRRASGVA